LIAKEPNKLIFLVHTGTTTFLLIVTSSADILKMWKRNTNFHNPDNWIGFQDDCGQNIFSFPPYMESSVVSLGGQFHGKQIILPVNGHFVFQAGVTTLSDQGTCHGRGKLTTAQFHHGA